MLFCNLVFHYIYRPLHIEDCVCVDKFKMDQVIRNLISNALKFTPRGGSVNVTVRKFFYGFLFFSDFIYFIFISLNFFITLILHVYFFVRNITHHVKILLNLELLF